jgi:hypothetical protein
VQFYFLYFDDDVERCYGYYQEMKKKDANAMDDESMLST